MQTDPQHILLTIDVEDWFQVENFKDQIPFSKWSSYDFRAEQNVFNLMEMLDRESERFMDGKPIKATFFILGWIAERFPSLVREIAGRGHEVASHGYGHDLCNRMSIKDLDEDLAHSRNILEDVIGDSVIGYRAPSFSINHRILDRIQAAGYCYDSSYNSFAMHGRYGQMNFSCGQRAGIAIQQLPGFFELPVSNLKIGGQVLPWGGGAYFRLIPFLLFRQGIQRIISRQGAYLFYLHPWEIDPGQPRVKAASFFRKFRHYTFLKRTEKKLAAMVQAFSDCAWVSCRDYLEEKTGSDVH